MAGEEDAEIQKMMEDPNVLSVKKISGEAASGSSDAVGKALEGNPMFEMMADALEDVRPQHFAKK